MTVSAVDVFPHVDASKLDCITDEQAKFFKANGLLVIRNVLKGQELADLREQTQALVQMANSDRSERPDFYYKEHEITKERVPMRIEYVVDKTKAGKALLGHPFVLRTVEKLQTRDFIPTWDSMVFKNAGAGAAIPWHRDAGTGCTAPDKPIFNVDFYLDEADMSNCLWGIPGSNLWSEKEASDTLARLNKDGFQTEGAVPITMNPGDVILHNILALHGSPPALTRLRRVIYLEFRPIEVELELGPHTPEYIPIKQKELLACLRDRANSPYSKGEKPFTYNPSPAYAPPPLGADEQLETYRYPHEKYWRSGKR
jgi:phytanoyl-CoA hydroxylase